jgi:hypothetical protein
LRALAEGLQLVVMVAATVATAEELQELPELVLDLAILAHHLLVELVAVRVVTALLWLAETRKPLMAPAAAEMVIGAEKVVQTVQWALLRMAVAAAALVMCIRTHLLVFR